MNDINGVCELRLCEQGEIILKPNQLYYFTVDKTCEKCRKIADQYNFNYDESD